jgi:hypothetical protein
LFGLGLGRRRNLFGLGLGRRRNLFGLGLGRRRLNFFDNVFCVNLFVWDFNVLDFFDKSF